MAWQSRFKVRPVGIAGKAALLAGVLTIGGGATPAAETRAALAAPANGEMGFILTAFAPAIHQGDEDCPEGLAGTVSENYLQSQPPAERARLSLKENEPEFTRRWKASVAGPNNTNICSNPELFDRPLQKTVQGKVAYGLDLDGGNASDGCSHVEFTGVDGRAGVDNQAYRAMGCTRTYRGIDGKGGDIVRGWNNLLATGEQSIVLLLRGVDSLVNDDNVEIIFATTDDRPVLDSKRGFIPGASFSVSENPRWRNVLRGRIVDGVLTSDPGEVRLTQRVGQGGIRGKNAEYHFLRSRFELRFQPDGTVKGLFGGYQPYRTVIQGTILGGLGAGETAGIDCPAQYATLKKLADGIRDPKTGQCTAISSAMDVSAVPAFVIDRPPVAAKRS
ncbi:hypothetical protein [Sphingomonas sp. G-3-2-10]|uniref:hypothetical protein n=1 Tax=Sphingomonas sp. G-3-2-10 TaxID=2728838 RepID=UPI00146DC935|nr:hypothetical protein [Sphingomonas sp. G-3-2-10]NML05820.1 hypothetical protein [Sphingomonas sp. G-3-2-10]